MGLPKRTPDFRDYLATAAFVILRDHGGKVEVSVEDLRSKRIELACQFIEKPSLDGGEPKVFVQLEATAVDREERPIVELPPGVDRR